MSSLSFKAKIFATVAALGSATAVAGLGTFGTFTDTTSASTPVDSGIVDLNLGAEGTANRLTVAATDIVPGDSMQRAFTLSNGTSTDVPVSVSLTSVATTSSLLDTDAVDGLQMKIEKCSVAWVEVGPPYTYTCAGTTSSVLAQRAVIGANLALSNLASTSSLAATDNLMMTLTLPTAADNDFQNVASTIAFSFTATQRAATNK